MNFYYTLFQILKVAEHVDTLSEVAKNLFLSQPYVSKVLKKAENEYHVKLINRNEKPIQITDEGYLVLSYLRQIVSSDADLKNKLAKRKNHNITILLTNPFLQVMVLNLIAKYKILNPTIDIMLKNEGIANGFTTLGNADNDILIGKKTLDPKIKTLDLPTINLNIYLPENNNLYLKQTKSLRFSNNYISDLQKDVYIGLENVDGIQDFLTEKISDIGIQSSPQIVVSSLANAIYVANNIKNSFTIANNYEIQHSHNLQAFNLIELPKKIFNFDSAVTYPLTSNTKVKKLSEFLQIGLTGLISRSNESN